MLPMEPIAVMLMLILMVGPMLRWRGDQASRLTGRAILPLGIAAVTGAAIAVLHTEAGLYPIVAIALSAGLAAASFMPLAGRNLWRTPLPIYGMVLAHFGLAVSIFGMASESGFSSERLAAIGEGQTASVADWQVKLKSVMPVVGENWIALEGEMVATRGSETFTLHPQTRQFFTPEQQTSEAALLTRWDGQLYAVIAPAGDGKSDHWQIRLWWKPFVSMIWFGGALVALGGLLALLGRLFRRARREPQNKWAQI